MYRDEILRALGLQEQELRAEGVESVSLFGFTARNEPHPGDSDLAVRLDASLSHGSFPYFGRLEG